ncbi:MAG: hypothetical protein PVF68_05235 [Acidobacteriota bacterium]|jgi:hypothetical protein
MKRPFRVSRCLTLIAVLLLPGLAAGAELWVPPRTAGMDGAFQDWPLAGASTSRFGFAVPSDLVAITGARLVILSGEAGSLDYDVTLSASRSDQRFDLYTDSVSGSVLASSGELAEIDLSTTLQAIPGMTAGTDYIALSVDIPGQVRTVGLRLAYQASSGPLHIVGDVEGPPTSATALGNSSDPFLPEHHVAVIENTRATESPTDDAYLNTGGLAIILHSHGDDQLDVFDLGAYDPAQHMLNTINRNDHFISFYRQNVDGSQDMVGRVEGISFWDMGEMGQALIDFFAQSGHLPWNFMELDVTFNDPETWLQWEPPTLSHPGFMAPTFDDGSLPYLAYNNDNCEFNQADELCLDFAIYEVDMTWRPGALPRTTWGSLDDPLMGLQLDPGSLSGTPPIEFGSPFLKVNDDMAQQFAHDALDFLGDIAAPAIEMKLNPVEFMTKYFFALRGGVTYESGSGDYAEWLERLDPEETLLPAEIVGVYGGKVTRRTAGADHAMVVSYKPIVLGNMPPAERKERFDKVAFMGQTLVKVIGVVRQGDFIVPSGREDGTGIAVSPERMKPTDFARVVGVAWGSGGRDGELGVVNVAVGLRPVEVAKVVGAQQEALEDLRRDRDAAGQEIATLRAEIDSLRSAMADVDALRQQVRALAAAVQEVGSDVAPRLASVHP